MDGLELDEGAGGSGSGMKARARRPVTAMSTLHPVSLPAIPLAPSVPELADTAIAITALFLH